MKSRVLWTFRILFANILLSSSVAQVAENRNDPMKQLQVAFPDTVELKNKGRLLEFCPDGTCDGFVTSGDAPVITLKDFAYLYVYFFSDYTVLDEWRNKHQAKNTAELVL